MANEPKKRSITGKLVANVLTEREDDFTCNVTYVANRSITVSYTHLTLPTTPYV